MLCYFTWGRKDFSREPVELKRRPAWEFMIRFGGASLNPTFGKGAAAPMSGGPFLLVFPPLFLHGWAGDGETERMVLHHTLVPEILEKNIPEKGFYSTSLTSVECLRLEKMAKDTQCWLSSPSPLRGLQTETLVGELSLMILEKLNLPSSSEGRKSDDRIDQAVIWYLEHMEEDPKYEDICRAVGVSEAHLRHLFHQYRGSSPRDVFKRLQMEVVRRYLREGEMTLEEIAPQVGFSSASSLSRAIKAYFGHTSFEIRNWRVPKDSLDLPPSKGVQLYSSP